jgi:hypothetical protein
VTHPFNVVGQLGQNKGRICAAEGCIHFPDGLNILFLGHCILSESRPIRLIPDFVVVPAMNGKTFRLPVPCGKSRASFLRFPECPGLRGMSAAAHRFALAFLLPKVQFPR